MKFTLDWLKDHLDTKASPDEIGKALTMIGLAMVLSLMVFGLSNDLFCP